MPRLDRNGIPILDPPKQTNQLPKNCDVHAWKEVRRETLGDGWDYENWISVRTYECLRCSRVITERDYHEATK